MVRWPGAYGSDSIKRYTATSTAWVMLAKRPPLPVRLRIQVRTSGSSVRLMRSFLLLGGARFF